MNDFFAAVYELFYYSSSFSGDLYAESLYTPLGISNILISLLLVMLFYYIINRPSFSRWYHWLIILIVNFIIALSLGVLLPQNKFMALGIQYGSEYYMFSLINAIISTLIFIAFSFMFRWWSTNAKRTPIPH